MSKAIRRRNIRVVVEVEQPSRWETDHKTPAQVESMLIGQAQEAAISIRRHVDGLSSVVAAWETTTECEHCDNEWADGHVTAKDAKPGEPEGMPICCDQEQLEWWRENITLWPEAMKHEPWISYSPGWPWEVPA